MADRRSKIPVFRIEKRAKIRRSKKWGFRAIAVLIAFGIIAILVLGIKQNPFAVFITMLYGAFGKRILFNETIKLVIPLLLTSLGLAIAFRAKVWNIGGEGQILIGGVASTAVAIYFSNMFGQVMILILMGLAGVLAAGAYGAVPGIFKAKWGTNEILLTLMMNYIALNLVIFLQNTPSWQDASNSYPKIRMLPLQCWLPRILGIHIGWIITLAVFLIYFFWTDYSRQGYEIKVIGDSLHTAQYAGINAKGVMIRTMFISATLCGLAGYLQVAGADGTLTDTTAGGMGFTAIAIVWIAEMNPWGMLLMSFFIAFLQRGADRLQTVYSIPTSFSDIMIGVLLLIVMASDFMVRYRVIINRSGSK